MSNNIIELYPRPELLPEALRNLASFIEFNQARSKVHYEALGNLSRINSLVNPTTALTEILLMKPTFIPLKKGEVETLLSLHAVGLCFADERKDFPGGFVKITPSSLLIDARSQGNIVRSVADLNPATVAQQALERLGLIYPH